MWFLILVPIAWLISEIAMLRRATRIVLGILAIAATCWLTYDLCLAEFQMRERFIRHDAIEKNRQTLKDAGWVEDRDGVLRLPPSK